MESLHRQYMMDKRAEWVLQRLKQLGIYTFTSYDQLIIDIKEIKSSR